MEREIKSNGVVRVNGAQAFGDFKCGFPGHAFSPGQLKRTSDPIGMDVQRDDEVTWAENILPDSKV